MSNMGRPVMNRNKVPARQWKLWSNNAKRIFNAVYHSMRPSNQYLLLHPKATPMKQSHWKTVRWNAAWTAACHADRYTPAALACRGSRGK